MGWDGDERAAVKRMGAWEMRIHWSVREKLMGPELRLWLWRRGN